MKDFLKKLETKLDNFDPVEMLANKIKNSDFFKNSDFIQELQKTYSESQKLGSEIDEKIMGTMLFKKLEGVVFKSQEIVGKFKNSDLLGSAKDFINNAKEKLGIGQNNNRGL